MRAESRSQKRHVDLQYPVLMKITNTPHLIVVLFSDAKCGTIVHYKLQHGMGHHNPGFKLGHYQDFWDMRNFELYNEQVILENN